MPTVTKAGHGIIIKSRRRGRYITHQLDPAGEQYLRDRYGYVDKLEIDVPTLLHLKRLGHAYTGRERREQGRRSNRYEQGTLFGPTPPARPPAPAPRPLEATPKPEECPQRCTACRCPVPAEAQYCQRCGKRLGPAAAPGAGTADYSWVYVVLAALAVIALFVFKK